MVTPPQSAPSIPSTPPAPWTILNPAPDVKRPATAPVAEPQVRFFDLPDDVRVVYDVNSMVAVRVDDGELWHNLHGWPSEGAGGVATGLLFTRDAPQFPLPAPLAQPHLVLNVTHGCNLACRYCFTNSYDDVREGVPLTMDLATAVGTIDRLDPAHVAFFGGEPMLAFDLIQQVIEHYRFRDTTWGMTTNATLIDRAEADWLAEHKFSLIVSIDGPQEIHEANRPMRCGNSSHEATMRGLSALRNAGLAKQATLRATFRTPDQLGPQVGYLNALVEDGFARHVSVEPVSRSEGCAMGTGEIDWPATEAAYWEVAMAMAEDAQAGLRTVVHQINSYLRRLANRSPQPSECGAGKSYFTVAPDGVIHACHREGSPVGHSGYGLDEARRAPWMDNRYYARYSCPGCPIRNVCGGGCRVDSLHADNFCRPTEAQCAYADLWFRCALWLLATLEPGQIRSFI